MRLRAKRYAKLNHSAEKTPNIDLPINDVPASVSLLPGETKFDIC